MTLVGLSVPGSRTGRWAPGVSRRLPLVVVTLAALDLAVICRHWPLGSLVAAGMMLTVPGALLLTRLPTLTRDPVVAWLYRLGLSLAVLLVVTAVAAGFGALVGIARPLDTVPLLIVYNVMLVGVALVAAPVRLRPAVPRRTRPSVPVVVAVLLPVLTAAGAERLNGGAGGAVSIAALVACLLLIVAGLVYRARLSANVVVFGLFCVAVALQWAHSLRSGYVLGWDIQQEFHAFAATQAAGQWTPHGGTDAYNAMLSITALPTALSNLTGLSGAYVFKVVYPLIYAAVPISAYCLATRWGTRSAAVVAGLLIVVQAGFFDEMPAVARQQVALFFFGMLLLTLSRHIPTGRYPVAFLLGWAMVVSHYSTTYIAMLVLVPAAVVAWGSARLSGRRGQLRALSPAVAGFVCASAVIWYGPLTHSTQNVSEFIRTTSRQGLQLMPNAHGGDVLSTWLQGNAPAQLSGRGYEQELRPAYQRRGWLHLYDTRSALASPLPDSTPPTLRGLVPAALPLFDGAAALTNQIVNVLMLLGAIAFAITVVRRRDLVGIEFATLAISMLAVLSLIRLSGSTADAYNQERALQQSLIVMAIPVAFLLSRLSARPRLGRAAGIVAGSLVGVIFTTSSGLSSLLAGGSAPVSIANSGEEYERFYVHDDEVAAAEWLAANRRSDLAVYADRYGQLRILGYTSIRHNLLGDVTPATVAQNSYVFAGSVNVVTGRARGAIDRRFATYVFPGDFLSANKDILFSSDHASIYR